MRHRFSAGLIAAWLAAGLIGCSQRGGSGSNGADRSTVDQQSNPIGSGPSKPAGASGDTETSTGGKDATRPGRTGAADRSERGDDRMGSGAPGTEGRSTNPSAGTNQRR